MPDPDAPTSAMNSPGMDLDGHVVQHERAIGLVAERDVVDLDVAAQLAGIGLGFVDLRQVSRIGFARSKLGYDLEHAATDPAMPSIADMNCPKAALKPRKVTQGGLRFNR